MKRSHRLVHRYLWLLLLPTLLLVAFVAHQYRGEHSPTPVNESLPKTNVKNALGESP